MAENLDISAKNISIDKKNQITIFKNNVIIKDDIENIIKSDFAKYDRNLDFFELKDNVFASDKYGNIIKSNNATYDKKLKILKSNGITTILTSQGYTVETKNIILDKNKGFVISNEKTVITDLQDNIINLDNFEYQADNNIFKSIGNIKITDKEENVYSFSQVYIDEIKKEIIGSEAKAFINQNTFKIDKNNKPRIFSNTVNLKEGKSKFIRSTFTMCGYRDNDKCPPWELRASEMTHDKKTKTIYYDNAVIRVYNIPILYIPKLSHPDPTVDRRSGFLIPSYSDTKNLGSSINLPYYWAINNDKDLTINNRLFVSEHPLFLGEYRQAYKNSDLIFDFGHTEGYKNYSATKKPGDKFHFFSKFVKKFETDDNTTNNLEVNLQHTSNKKFLKLYKIKSNLVDYEADTLENFIDFTHYDDDNNLFLAAKASSFRTLKDKHNDKYEHILPEVTFNKNLFNDNYGFGNFQTSLKVHNFDTNKYKKFLINDFEWTSNDINLNSKFDGKFLANIKNINYEVKNLDKFKKDTTAEMFGAVGYLTSIDLYKQENEFSKHLLRPKALLKYAPNFMRKEEGDFSLNEKNIFSLDRLGSEENFESGTNLTLGLDYEIDNNENKFNFSIGQIINEKKNNKNMPASSSLDDRFSDVTGNFGFNNNNLKLDYNYSLDQNYKEMNYNEVNLDYDVNNFKVYFDYLNEDKINSVKEYINSGIEIKKGNNGLFAFNSKRNLITNSSEFYKLSYEYINDCLRAGLVYRREFYDDTEIESDNSLMFNITLNTFGSVNSPKFSQ